MSKVLVFDIDDTISIHTNRDYVNAKPIQPVIDKLNRLHDEGYYIKLFTGRGQVSCNGNLDLIIERNKDVLENWLKKHDVKYDELIFGKPLGDWYIDDKGMSVKDFLKADFYELKGGSNSSIRRELNKVIKTAKNSQSQYAWYKYVNNYYKTIAIPIVYRCVVDTMYNQIDYLREKKKLEVKASISKVPIKISVISVLFFVPLILLLILSPILISYLK